MGSYLLTIFFFDDRILLLFYRDYLFSIFSGSLTEGYCDSCCLVAS